MFEILLAEDNPGDVLLFREALNSRELPCNLVVAADGQQAIALLGSEGGRGPLVKPRGEGGRGPSVESGGEARDHPAQGSPSEKPSWRPHLIVLDVNLPKYNGDAVLRHIRGQPGLTGVPVIMLTSSASPADRAVATELGANLYLQKSSDLDELLEVGKIVEAILRRSGTL